MKKVVEMAQARVFLAWHYTTATRFLQILRQRALVPRRSGDDASGEPVLWFSVHDDFEPSACLTVSRGDGRLGHCSVSETAELGQGLVRLGVPIRTLMTCAELKREAHMSDETWQQVCDDARELGSDPDQWFGCLHPVALDQCVIDVRDEDGRWQRMQGQAQRGESASRTERSHASHVVTAR